MFAWEIMTMLSRDVCLGDQGAVALSEGVRPRLHPLRLLHQQDPQAIPFHFFQDNQVLCFRNAGHIVNEPDCPGQPGELLWSQVQQQLDFTI